MLSGCQALLCNAEEADGFWPLLLHLLPLPERRADGRHKAAMLPLRPPQPEALRICVSEHIIPVFSTEDTSAPPCYV